MQSQRLASVPRSRQQSVLPSFGPPSTANAQTACNSTPSVSVVTRQQHPEIHGMHAPQCKRPNTSFASELGMPQQRDLDAGTNLGSYKQQRQVGEGGGERLSQLHTRLQQEAEKIRQWKTATEMDLKQKDTKLQEALHTVDTQRRALVELQLSNATLESKLRDEVINQEDIRRRIDATREMCTLLKNHVARTEDVLAVGERDKETFQQVDKQRVDEYQALVIKFQELELEQTTAQEALREKFACEEAEKKKVLAGLQLELAAAGKRVEALEVEQQQGTVREEGLKADLDRMTKEYCALEQQKLTLEHIARNKDESLVEQLSELNTVRSNFQQKEGEVLGLQVQLEKAQQLLLSLEQEHHSALNSAQAAQQLHQEELESLQLMCSEVKEQLQVVEMELRTTTEERSRLQEGLKRLRDDLGSLEAEKQSCIDTINQLTKQKEKLTNQCNKLALEQEEACAKQVGAERQTQETMEELHRTQTALAQAQASLQSITEEQGAVEAELAGVRNALRAKETDLDLVKEQLCEALHQRTVSCDKLRTLAEAFNGARIPSPENADIELMVLADYVSESVEGLQQRLEVYQLKCSELVGKLDETSKENTDLRSASLKLKDQLNQKSELFNAEQEKQEASLLELKEKLLQKAEELACVQDRLERMEVACSHGEEVVKKTESEREAVEGKMALLAKKKTQLEAENADLQVELRNALEAKEALEEQIALLGEKDKSTVSNYQKLSTLNDDLTAELAEKTALVDTLTAKVEECRAEVEQVVRECERSRVEHEQQIADLANTLQMYQVENQKIVDQKDREMASMQEKLEVAQSAERKVKSLQAELSQAVSERDQAHLQLQKEQRRVEELEKQSTIAPSFKVPVNPSTSKAHPPEPPLPPHSSAASSTPRRNREQGLSVHSRMQQAPSAVLSNSRTQKTPTEQGRPGQEEVSDGSVGEEEEEECVMEVNQSQQQRSLKASKTTHPSTPTTIPLYLRESTNCPPPARPFTPHSYSTPKTSSFLSHLKTPTVPPRASSANFRIAPSPSVRRAPPRGVVPPQSSPRQSPRHTRSKENSCKKPNRAAKPNSRQADTSLKGQTQAWAKKVPPNTRKSSGEKRVGAVKDRKGHGGMPGMGMSWFDQDDIFGFGPEQ